MLYFRQTYMIESKIYQLGDITFKLGTITKDITNKYLFLEMEIPYIESYNQIKEFAYEIVSEIFSKSVTNCCMFNNNMEKLYNNSKLKLNNHWGWLQYVELIFSK
jgi:hypothetical protein